MKYFSIIIFLLFVQNFAFSQVKLYPKNEVYKDSSFTDFICKFQYAIFKHDKQFLLNSLDKNIQNSFGDDNGIENFKSKWNLNSETSEIWPLLSQLISMGASFSKQENRNSFIFPSIFTMDIPVDTLDVYGTSVVIAKNVNVREKPSKNSKIIAKLSHEVVTFDYASQQAKDWTYVSTIDKKIKGYVNNEFLWILVDYRMCFVKKDGEWKMTFLLAGD